MARRTRYRHASPSAPGEARVTVRDLGPEGYSLAIARGGRAIETVSFPLSRHFEALDWLQSRGVTSAGSLMDRAAREGAAWTTFVLADRGPCGMINPAPSPLASTPDKA